MGGKVESLRKVGGKVVVVVVTPNFFTVGRGGAQGGGGGREGREVKGKVARNSATRAGLLQRSRTPRSVGWEGQANR